MKKTISNRSLNHVLKFILLPRWRRILISFLLIILGRVSSLVLPGSSKFLVDHVFARGDYTALKWILIATLSAVAINAVCSYSLVKILSVEAHHLISELRVVLQKHVLRLPLSFFFKEKSGSIVSRVMTDVEGIRNVLGTGLIQLFGGGLTAIMSLVILIKINLEMTLVSLIVLLFFSVIMFRWFKTIRPIFRQRGEINAAVTGRLTETIGGIKVIKSFGAEKREEEVFARGTHQLFENVKKTLTATARVSMISMLVTGLISSLVMGISSYFVIQGEMTSGDFVAYLMYLALLVFPIVQLSNIGSQLTESFAGMDRMNEILSLPTEETDDRRIHQLDHLKEKVVFNKVGFSYDSTRTVLQGLNFELKKGEVVALVGASGSGKSTIANLVLSLLRPSRGTIYVDGIDLTTIELASYRKLIAVVMQDDFLFDGTIRENILFAKPEASERELNRVVRLAHLDQFTKKLKKRLNTVIGERGIKLSGGQKQRLSIARAILTDPQILVLDEATSSLDNESEMYIQNSLKSLFQNRTTLVIAHRLSTIERADKILVVEEGRIVESGKHRSLLKKKGRYHQLFTYQAKI